jgi:uncharacterized iron-regulated protein
MHHLTRAVVLASILAIAGTAGLVSCALDPTTGPPAILSEQQRAAGVIDPTDPASFERLLDDATGKRVIYLGEIHDRYDHHVNQLQIIRGLQARGHALAIGLEAFQAPFQNHLDAYGAGQIDEKEMLRRTEYYDRWRFDYRLYRDILRFAKQHEIPLVALNAPAELVEAVSRKGIDGLDPNQRGELPAEIPPADAAYEQRLRRAFAMHGNLPKRRFQRFMEVQSVWDEYMAREAADYLSRHPERTLVVLVGSAHVLHESAIPGRLKRRYRVEHRVIVTAPFSPVPGAEPDHVLAARGIDLPPRGRTGMTLLQDPDGVTVKSVANGGAAQKAGIEPGDRILKMQGQRINSLSDVRLALTDSKPSDRLELETVRVLSGSPKREEKILTLL